jgi:hypothetical protein
MVMAGRYVDVARPAPIIDVLSKGLRDMMSGPGDGQAVIPFTDDVLETAETIRGFLELCHSQLSVQYLSGSIEPLLGLIKFLDKYDCETAKRTFISALWGRVFRRQVTPVRAFILAANLEDRFFVNFLTMCFQIELLVGFEPGTKPTAPDMAFTYEDHSNLPKEYSFAVWSAGRLKMQGANSSDITALFNAEIERLGEG